MNKSVKTKKLITRTKPAANSRNRSRRKKIKLVEEVEEEVKDEAVAESEDEAGSVVNESANENEDSSESDEEIKSESDEEMKSESDEEIKSESDEEIKSESDEEIKSENDEEIKSEIDSEEETMSDSDKDEVQTKVIKRKRKRKIRKYNPKEEARLERLVFGDPKDVINNLLKVEESKIRDDADRTRKLPEVPDDSEGDLPKMLDDSDDDLPKVLHDSDDDMPEMPDKSDNNLPEVQEDSDDSKDSDIGINGDAENDESVDIKKEGKAAWVDEDDNKYSVQDALEYQNRKLPKGRTEEKYTELLEKKFTQLVGTPKWASLDAKVKDEDEDSDSEVLKHTTHLEAPKGKKLRKGIIEIKALTDINKSTHNEGPLVSSLQFHPTSTVALVAGESGILSLFQIDGKENNKLQSIAFEKFHINCAKFLKEGSEVIMGSRHRSYSQAYDLMSGKIYKIPLPHGITNMQKFEVSPDGKWIAIVGRKGEIHLLTGATKELVATFKMNKRCLALAFSPDSGKLISHGDTEEMYIWDLKSRSCLHKAIDDGCIASSAIAFSPSGQFIATGSKQGVVNIYESESVLKSRTPQPLKIIMNLVTSITNLKFNPTSEILAMSSSLKANAFKMVHIPSFTVFANFPTYQTKINNPLDIDFSPNSGYLGLSNNKSYAYLYRLKHYGNY